MTTAAATIESDQIARLNASSWMDELQVCLVLWSGTSIWRLFRGKRAGKTGKNAASAVCTSSQVLQRLLDRGGKKRGSSSYSEFRIPPMSNTMDYKIPGEAVSKLRQQRSNSGGLKQGAISRLAQAPPMDPTGSQKTKQLAKFIKQIERLRCT